MYHGVADFPGTIFDFLVVPGGLFDVVLLGATSSKAVTAGSATTGGDSMALTPPVDALSDSGMVLLGGGNDRDE